MSPAKETETSGDAKPTSRAAKAVIVLDRISVLSAESAPVAASPANLTPRRRSARLCASPAPDYSPVVTKRRRSTSSTSSMTEEVKAIVPRLGLRNKKGDGPETIDEEEVIEIEQKTPKIIPLMKEKKKDTTQEVFDVEDDVIDVVSVNNAVEPETKKASPVKKVSPVKSAKMSEKEKADEQECNDEVSFIMESEEKSKEEKKIETKNGKSSQIIEVVDVDDDSMSAQPEVVQEAKPEVVQDTKPEVVQETNPAAKPEVFEGAKPGATLKAKPEVASEPETKVQATDKDSSKNVSEEKENTSEKNALAQKSKYDYSVPGKKCQDLSLSSRVSGRFWKSERDRFRSVIKSRGLKQNFKQRMEHKAMLNRVKEMEKALKDDVVRQREELKARQEANKKKREENLRKTEIVQVIKNPAKLKRMKKKQIRLLEKRDTTVIQKN